MKAIKNVKIYDFENYIDDGYVVFDEVIKEVGLMKDYHNNNYQEIDGSHLLLLPNLVNGHSHIYSTFARGMSVPFNPTSFTEILEQLWWKLDRNLDNEMTYYSGIISGIEYLKNGVTTIIDHHASGEILGSLKSLDDSLEHTGLRRSLCFETSDRFNIEECIEENLSYITNEHTGFSNGLFGLHAAFTLSDETLAKVSKVIGKNPIHIHVAESIDDQKHSIKKYGERVIHRLNRFGLIHPNSIITHGLYLDDSELDIIKKCNAVIALNVTSNMNNSVGLPDYQRMKEKGIKVIIGNDGISQNMAKEYSTLFFTMHHKDECPTAFTYEDLRTIINNTYEYASEILGIKLGKIKKGYVADFQLFNYNPPTPLHKETIFGHLLFGLFNSFSPKTVYVNGKRLLDEYEPVIQTETLYKDAQNQAKRLWNKLEKEGAL